MPGRHLRRAFRSRVWLFGKRAVRAFALAPETPRNNVSLRRVASRRPLRLQCDLKSALLSHHSQAKSDKFLFSGAIAPENKNLCSNSKQRKSQRTGISGILHLQPVRRGASNQIPTGNTPSA